ncbi:MAG TPA: 4-(cytidine 5'-diphospho)-2-C-methyl-D-erythritol kinase [Candidatus Eisenbacteria bacterium]|nr:4-(cytidine 5'-diphospho)-2-C-methyl-D-erythritol kinase [Candidatus Eisenbacteria bacterium]
MKIERARDFLAEPFPRGYALGIHAFAKVNLGLQVGRRRPDGYHDLDTVFQTIDFADTLYARPRPHGIRLHVVRRGPARLAGFPVSVGSKNLVVRAARLLQERYRVRAGADLLLVKRVPAGSGLGGGSSDGVAALKLLARLWGIRNIEKEGERLARTLGSDCAFLWKGGAARARGRGDKLERLPVLMREAILVVPRIGVSTAAAYAWLDAFRSSKDLTASKPVHTIDALRGMREAESPASRAAENDFEEVVCRHCPEVDAARRLLVEQGVGSVRMSGSGAAVFGFLPRGRDPLIRFRRLRRTPFDVVLTRFTRFGSLWCRKGRPARKRP